MKTRIYVTIRKDKISKKDGTYPLYYIVRHNGRNLKFHTGEAIHPKDWKGRKALTKNDRINFLLTKKINEFNAWRFDRERDERPINEMLIKDFFSIDKPRCFIGYCERKIADGLSLEENTIKGYRTLLKRLREFRPKILFSDLDLNFIEDFDRFFRRQGLQDSALFGYHKNLKAMIYRARKDKLVKSNPYQEGFIMPRVRSREVWLNEEEIKKIENLPIPAKDARLQRTRYLFLFACFTGLRYSDIVTLEWKHIKKLAAGDFIVKEQVKTKKITNVPLSKKAVGILGAFKEAHPTLVFGRISNQKLNCNIKLLVKMAGINKSVSSHTGRHSFASNLGAKKKPLLSISRAMGHCSISVTERYVKLANESLSDLVRDE